MVSQSHSAAVIDSHSLELRCLAYADILVIVVKQ